MLILLIVVGVIVLYAVVRLAWILSHDELEAGGSYGQQLFSFGKLHRVFRRKRPR